jgi:magnesium-transporting ATPase (P-type)
MVMTKPKRTLERQDPRESILQNDIVIRISVTSAIIIAVLIFILICFIVVPPTYGFFVW